MFNDASSFNQPLNSWTPINATAMNSMFRDATLFNQDLSNWNIDNVVNLSNMFNGATSFNQNISSWDTSNVTTMINTFYKASSFNQPIGRWNFNNVVDVYTMITGNGFTYKTYSNFIQDLSSKNPTSGLNFGEIDHMYIDNTLTNDAIYKLLNDFNIVLDDQGSI